MGLGESYGFWCIVCQRLRYVTSKGDMGITSIVYVGPHSALCALAEGR